MVNLDLKLSHGEETRLLTLPASPAPTWDDFVAQVKQRFSLAATPSAVTYGDEEGDEITVSSDAELTELFATSAGETSLSLIVVTSTKEPASPPTRSPETVELLDKVRKALEHDLTLAHDLRHIVHDVLGPPPPPHPHHFRHHHPDRHFGKFGHHGGRGGRVKGPGRWEMRQEHSASSSSSDVDADSVTEKQPSPENEGRHTHGERQHRGGRKGHKYGRGFPHHHDFFAPPPPPPHHSHHHPPPPGHESFSSYPTMPFTSCCGRHGHGHGYGMEHGKHGFQQHPPHRYPPFGPGKGGFTSFFDHHPLFSGHGYEDGKHGKSHHRH
ncbi:hypothetical protein JCM11641_005099 [Rhodosporidiobolus odoratus]